MFRSPEYAVQVVNNQRGWWINLAIDRSPYKAYGPYEDEVTIIEALQIVAVELRMGD